MIAEVYATGFAPEAYTLVQALEQVAQPVPIYITCKIIIQHECALNLPKTDQTHVAEIANRHNGHHRLQGSAPAHQSGCDWLNLGSNPVMTGASSQRSACRSRASSRRDVFLSTSIPSEKLRFTCVQPSCAHHNWLQST